MRPAARRGRGRLAQGASPPPCSSHRSHALNGRRQSGVDTRRRQRRRERRLGTRRADVVAAGPLYASTIHAAPRAPHTAALRQLRRDTPAPRSSGGSRPIRLPRRAVPRSALLPVCPSGTYPAAQVHRVLADEAVPVAALAAAHGWGGRRVEGRGRVGRGAGGGDVLAMGWSVSCGWTAAGGGRAKGTAAAAGGGAPSAISCSRRRAASRCERACAGTDVRAAVAADLLAR